MRAWEFMSDENGEVDEDLESALDIKKKQLDNQAKVIANRKKALANTKAQAKNREAVKNLARNHLASK